MFGGSRVTKMFSFGIETRDLTTLIKEVLPIELDRRLGGAPHLVETSDHVKFKVTNSHPKHSVFPHKIEITIGEGEFQAVIFTHSKLPEGTIDALGLEETLRSRLWPNGVPAAA